jgi:hypothetical protein
MPKRKENDASAAPSIEKDQKIRKADQKKALSSDLKTSSEKLDSISKSKPPTKDKNDHRFHKAVGERDYATKVLYKKRNESRDDAVNRLKEAGWMDDNTRHHESPDTRALHEGDSSKCPNCARYFRKNLTGPGDNSPVKSSQPLNSVEDVEKAWGTIPKNTIPYFEFDYYSENLVVPLISKPCSVNEAMALFQKAQWFSHEKKELKAVVTGKAESHICPNALQVRVGLTGDMRKLITKLDGLRGWAPVLIGSDPEVKLKKVVLKPRIEVVYTPQGVNLQIVNQLSQAVGLKEESLKPKEELKDGRHHKEGNDTAAEADE